MKVWILFAVDGEEAVVDVVFAKEEDAYAVQKEREAEHNGMTYYVDWFEVR